MTNKIMVSFFLMLGSLAQVSAAVPGDLMTKQLDRANMAAIVGYNDASLISVKYVGSSSQAAVVIAEDTFGTETPIGTADLSFDTSNALYDTLGELCDAIDADADYTCVLTGGKRDDDSSLLKNVSAAAATDAKTVGGYAVLIDTAGAAATDPYSMRIGITPMTGRRVILKYCTVQNDGTGTLEVYGKLRKFEGAKDGVTRNDSTKVLSFATANDTEETNGNVYGVDFLEFGKDEHVVISAGNSTTTQTSTSFLLCVWDEE